MDDLLVLKPYTIRMKVAAVPNPLMLTGTIIASSLVIARAKAIDDIKTCGLEWQRLDIDWPTLGYPFVRLAQATLFPPK